jgi:hypothetical protein
MHENPLYLTPNGYKRLPKNPYATKASTAEAKELLAKRAALKKMKDGRGISEEAAKVLATAIKGILKK